MDNFFEPNVPHIAPEDVKKAIDAKEAYVLLDVRTPEEFKRNRIAGSVNVPVDKVDCDVQKAIPDKSQKVFVYCLSGSRSVHAVDAMIKLGYTNVFDMPHGLLAWRVKGYPVI
jgi:rhodanese-related sulfurtransferase